MTCVGRIVSMNLPSPRIDMNDGHAADWLAALADFYTGPDRSHVLALAARLRTRDDDERKAVLDAERKREEARLRRIEDAEAELEAAERELEAAREEAEEAREKARTARAC